MLRINGSDGNGRGGPGMLSTKTHASAKSLFTEGDIGVLDVPQDELEGHLEKPYSDPLHDMPLLHMAGIPTPASPGVAIDMSNLKVNEVREFVKVVLWA